MMDYSTQIICSSTEPAMVEKALTTDQAVALMRMQLSSQEIDRPSKPFAQSEWVFVCVDLLIKAARSVPLVLSTTGEDVVESGPLYDLLYNNREMPFSRFISETVGYFALYRTVYWYFPEMAGARPTRIQVVGPEQCRAKVEGGELVAWELLVNGRWVPVPVYSVFPVTDFNPYSRWSGLGPATVGRLAISSAYQASLFNESALANGAMVGTVIEAPGRMDEPQRRALEAQFEARYGGAKNARKSLVLTGDAKIKSIAQTMVDMQMLDLRQFDAKVICSLFGVSPELVGLATEAQYAHGPAQQRFVAGTLAGLLAWLGDHITLGLAGRFRGDARLSVKAAEARTLGQRWPLGKRASFREARHKAMAAGAELFAWFAIEEHPTMQEMLRERTDKVIEYGKAGLPLNAIIDAYDLPFEHVKWGDEWWIPMGQVPASFTLEGGPEALAGPSQAEGEGEEGGEGPAAGEGGEPEPEKSFNPAGAEERIKVRKRELEVWRRWAASWRGIEREYSQTVRSLWVRQQRQVIAQIRKVWPADKRAKAGEEIVGRVILDILGRDKTLTRIHAEMHRRAAELGIKQVLAEIAGVTGEEAAAASKRLLEYPGVRDALARSTHQMSGVGKTTADMLERQLRQGLDAGDDLNAMVKRVEKVMGSNRARALRIARTETGSAVSCGRQEAMREVGGELKSWITSGDDEVRDLHRDAGVRYAKGIPLDEHFMLGGDPMMYPGDPAASPANRINCRCLHIVRKAEGKTYDLTHYERVKFVAYERAA